MVGSIPAWSDALADAATQRAGHAQVRRRMSLRFVSPVEITDGERTWINFSSNDYLGLRGHPALAQAMSNGAAEFGTGSGASALVTGYHPAHRDLESRLAEFLGREQVLLCSSGYLANLAVSTSLASRGDLIVQDHLCHASLIDAARLSGARLARYPHLDLEGMRRQLQLGAAGYKLLVSDGVFSMDGDTAPLRPMAALAREEGALLVVDDAHGIGVLGDGGGGLAEQEGLNADELPVLVGTLGKAFGCAGAFVAAKRDIIEHLVNEARSYIFTTAMPPALALAGSAALECVRKDRWRREDLYQTIEDFRSGARARGIGLIESGTPIQPLVLGGSEQAMALSAALSEQGFMVSAIRPPTVPAGGSRLRITLSAKHESGQITALLDALEQCLAGR